MIKKSEEGIALLMTLWVLVLLMVMAMNFSFSTRRGSASTRNFKEETIAYYSAVSAYEDTLRYLLFDKSPGVDFIDKDGVFWSDIDRAPVSGQRQYGNVRVEIKITDEESKLNINTLTEPMLRNLFTTYARIPEDAVQELIDSVSDWKDPDDLHHLSGAETEYYKSLKPAYAAKNNALDVPEELLLIRGFKREYIFGGDETTAIYPLLTTYSTAVNINTAPSEVLALLGLGQADIENILNQRTKEAGGVKIVPSGIAGINITTASSNFRIEVTAAVEGSKQVVRLTSVVKKISGLKGPELRTIYWKESVEGSRA